MAPDCGHAFRSDPARHPGLLSIAADQDKIKVVRPDRAGDDRFEYDRKRLRDFPAAAADKPGGAVVVDPDCNTTAAFEGANNRQLCSRASDSRRAARTDIARWVTGRHRQLGTLVHAGATTADECGGPDRHRH